MALLPFSYSIFRLNHLNDQRRKTKPQAITFFFWRHSPPYRRILYALCMRGLSKIRKWVRSPIVKKNNLLRFDASTCTWLFSHLLQNMTMRNHVKSPLRSLNTRPIVWGLQKMYWDSLNNRWNWLRSKRIKHVLWRRNIWEILI